MPNSVPIGCPETDCRRRGALPNWEQIEATLEYKNHNATPDQSLGMPHKGGAEVLTTTITGSQCGKGGVI